MYEVFILKRVWKKLHTLPSKQQALIAQGIHFLGLNPDDVRLDIKRLAGRSGYRIRVGDWRILYERDDCLKIISIEKIGA